MGEEAESVTRFAALEPDTRAFLTRLRREDICLLESGIELVRASLTVGRFMKWLVISLAGAFLGAVMLWEAAMKLAAWMRGFGR